MEACRRCGEAFRPKRLMQVYCSRRCRVADAVARHRSDYKNQPLTAAPEKRLQALSAAVVAPESQPQSVHHQLHGSPKRRRLSARILRGRLSCRRGLIVGVSPHHLQRLHDGRQKKAPVRIRA